jgi:hypothetical protein
LPEGIDPAWFSNPSQKIAPEHDVPGVAVTVGAGVGVVVGFGVAVGTTVGVGVVEGFGVGVAVGTTVGVGVLFPAHEMPFTAKFVGIALVPVKVA